MNTQLSNPLDDTAAQRATTAVGTALGDGLGEPALAHRVESILADIIPDLPTERQLLIAAYRAGSTRELKSALSSSQPVDISDSLVRRLAGQHYSEAGARFAITAWRHAIGSRNVGATVSKRSGSWQRGVAFLAFGLIVLGVATATLSALTREEESTETTSNATGYLPDAKAVDEPPQRLAQEAVKPTATPVVPAMQDGDSPRARPAGQEEWCRMELDGPSEHVSPLYRLTLNGEGYVSFSKPSVSTFVLTSDAQPRPVPPGKRVITKPTKRTVHYHDAKCHISHGTRNDIWFTWFYETAGAWLVETRHASKEHGNVTNRIFLYRLSDESWWILENDPTSSLAQSFLEGLSATPRSSAVCRVHDFVKRYHLSDGGERYFNDFFSRSTPLAVGDRPAAR